MTTDIPRADYGVSRACTSVFSESAFRMRRSAIVGSLTFTVSFVSRSLSALAVSTRNKARAQRLHLHVTYSFAEKVDKKSTDFSNRLFPIADHAKRFHLFLSS
ncbi:hypothetical protein KP509_14G062800 [Ceratopteris richardii]|uniref:Uncharacterized protein n=1 Tax=Ceratopteris richardii TaxID=49495 RepID=A0A8T2TAH2_CERRI|nr:hypothetical protein KP509_14G062800 [Ceratopteris richardii]